jgi:hypothetical protein
MSPITSRLLSYAKIQAIDPVLTIEVAAVHGFPRLGGAVIQHLTPEPTFSISALAHGSASAPPLAPDLPPLPVDGLPVPLPDLHFPVELSHFFDVSIHAAFHTLQSAGLVAEHVLSDLYSGLIVPAPFVIPALRIYAAYHERFDHSHGPDRIYSGSKHVNFSVPDIIHQTYQHTDALLTMNRIASKVQCNVDPGLEVLQNSAARFTEGNKATSAVMATVVSEFNAILKLRKSMPVLYIACNAPDEAPLLLARAFPQFRPVVINHPHPHPVPQVVRTAFLAIAQHHIGDQPIHLIGGSSHQAAIFPNVLHNSAPILTGRDEYRHHHRYAENVRNFAEALRCDHTFQGCPHVFSRSVALAPFSAGDIPAEDFIRTCLSKGINRALILINIPLPFLDDRVKRYIDEENGFLYTRSDGKIHMSYLTGGSAGYTNDEFALLSWVRPLPIFAGTHVTLEVIEQYSTSFLLELTLGVGPTEQYPITLSVRQEKHYILPLLRPYWYGYPDEHYVVPASRFDACNAFISAGGAAKADYAPLIGRIRGYAAEVTINGRKILPRWSLTSEEMISTATHVLAANAKFQREIQFVAPRYLAYIDQHFSRHEGSFLKRYGLYLYDLITFSSGVMPDAHLPSSWERIKDHLFLSRLSAKPFDDPYHPVLHYTVLQGETLKSNLDLGDLKTDCKMIYNAIKKVCPRAQIRACPQPPVFVTPVPIAPAPLLAPGRPLDNGHLIDPAPLPAPIVPVLPVLHDIPAFALPPLLDIPELVPLPLPLPLTSPSQSLIDLNLLLLDIAPYLSGDSSPASSAFPSPCGIPLPLSGAASPDFALVPLPPSSTCSPVLSVSSLADDDDFFTLSPVSARVTTPLPIFSRPVLVMPTPLTSRAPVSFIPKVPASSVSSRKFVLPRVIKSKASLPDWAVVNLDEHPMSLAPIDRTVTGDLPRAGPFLQPPDAMALELHPADLERHTSVIIDFEAELDYIHGGSLSNQAFADAITDFSDLDDAIRTHAVIHCPDRGALSIVEACFKTPRSRRDCILDFDAMRVAASTDSLGNKTPFELMAHIVRFFLYVSKLTAFATEPSLLVRGIAASAKSSLIRLLIAKHRTVLVVVPTAALASDWQSLCPAAEVVTQHNVPKRDHYDLVVIDEYGNFSSETLLCWMTIAHSLDSPLFFIGDELQQYRNANLGADMTAYASPTLLLSVSFNVPLDALALMVAYCEPNRAAFIQTRSRVQTSVFFTDDHAYTPSVGALVLKARLAATGTYMGLPLPSVTQVQGRRSVHTVLRPGLVGNAYNWLTNASSILIVTYSRHSESCVIVAPAEYHNRLVAGRALYRCAPRVAGGSFRSFVYASIDVHYKHGADDPSRYTEDVLPCVDTTHRDLPIPFIPAQVAIYHDRSVIADHISARAQIAPATHANADMDFNLGFPSGLKMLGSFGLEEAIPTRYGYDGAESLGLAQTSRDSAHDVNNLCLRQLAMNRKSTSIDPQAIADAKLLLSEFVEAYIDPAATVIPRSGSVASWIHTRTPAFLARLGEGFGATASSVSFTGFLKTQTKIKPKKHFANEVGYGQQVISGSPEYNELMGPYSRDFCALLSASTRKGKIVFDIGRSDAELSEELRDTCGTDPYAFGNTQLDITRQDSSHCLVHVLMFTMLMEMFGLPEDICKIYLEMRLACRVKSMMPSLYDALIKLNLPSGDPFTLPCNCVHAAATIVIAKPAVKSEDVKAIVQKGDDWLSTLIADWPVQHPSLLKTLGVTFTTAAPGTPPYHAGRFVVGSRFIADPTRMFYKHFARTDAYVSQDDLYIALRDRGAIHTWTEYHAVARAVSCVYPDVSYVDAILHMEVMHACRSRKYFDYLSKNSGRRVIESAEYCLEVAVAAVRPGRTKHFYRLFRNLDLAQATILLDAYSIPHTTPFNLIFDLRFKGVVLTPNHAFALI